MCKFYKGDKVRRPSGGQSRTGKKSFDFLNMPFFKKKCSTKFFVVGLVRPFPVRFDVISGLGTEIDLTWTGNNKDNFIGQGKSGALVKISDTKMNGKGF